VRLEEDSMVKIYYKILEWIGALSRSPTNKGFGRHLQKNTKVPNLYSSRRAYPLGVK